MNLTADDRRTILQALDTITAIVDPPMTTDEIRESLRALARRADSAPDSPQSDAKAAEATTPQTDQTKRTEGAWGRLPGETLAPPDPRKRINRLYHSRGCEDHPDGWRWCQGHPLPLPPPKPGTHESDLKYRWPTRCALLTPGDDEDDGPGGWGEYFSAKAWSTATREPV